MLRLYITLAGGASADAATVFLTIESDGARKSAITALADRRLDEEQKRLFWAILKIMGQRARYRHKLAHWVWGFSKMLPDALLLADRPRFWARIHRIRRGTNARVGQGLGASLRPRSCLEEQVRVALF